MSPEVDAARALLSLSGGASENELQIVQLENELLKLDWSRNTFECFRPEALVTLQITQSDKRTKQNATSKKILQNSHKAAKTGLVRKEHGLHLLPSQACYLEELRQETQELLSGEMKISPEKKSQISSTCPEYYACPCKSKRQKCPNDVMLMCSVCPFTKLSVDGEGLKNYGQNPIAGGRRDIERNFYAHVNAKLRNNHKFWYAVHKLSELLDGSKKQTEDHDNWIKILQNKQHLWNKMQDAYRKANLLDSNEAKEWGNQEKFRLANALFKHFEIDTHATKPRERKFQKRSRSDSEDEEEESQNEVQKRSRPDSKDKEEESSYGSRFTSASP